MRNACNVNELRFGLNNEGDGVGIPTLLLSEIGLTGHRGLSLSINIAGVLHSVND